MKNTNLDLVEIIAIEENEEEDTYDITLTDEHMFFANDIYTHNSGVNAEIVTMEAISEAFNKCFVADFICSLSRTIEDRNNNTGRLYVAKNRNGADGLIFPLFMDTSNVKIRVLEPTNESIEDLKKNTAKRQMSHLREQYKQMKNEQGEN